MFRSWTNVTDFGGKEKGKKVSTDENAYTKPILFQLMKTNLRGELTNNNNNCLY